MAPMLTYHDGQFLASWKNSPVDEDQPGQRVLFSQSKDGVTWSGTNGSNILFPNMSTGANPAALFAEPALYINGRTYAAASPLQFCLYPCSYPGGLWALAAWSHVHARSSRSLLPQLPPPHPPRPCPCPSLTFH